MRFLLLFLCCTTATARAQNAPWFPIEKDGRHGFIDQHGHEVIPPRFRDLGEFTDSLCPARLNGTWGYIDRRGDWAILPQYDYAQNFSEGYACVWRNGQAAFVDHRGNIQFKLPDSTSLVGPFNGGRATFRRRQNVFEQTFELSTDGQILPYTDVNYAEGLTVLTKTSLASRNGRFPFNEYALADSSSGQVLVPFGRYPLIHPPQGGFVEVTFFDTKGNPQTTFLNRFGKPALTLPGPKAPSCALSEGVVATWEYPKNPDDILEYEKYRLVWYDTSGQVALTQNGVDATPFHQGRAFVLLEPGVWRLMGRNGQFLSDTEFSEVEDGFDFSDNAVVVGAYVVIDSQLVTRFGLIDSLGRWVVSPQFDAVGQRGFQREGLLVGFDEPNPPERQRLSGLSETTWGLIDCQGDWIFPAKFKHVDPEGFKNGLLYVETDALAGYVNSLGCWIWKTTRHKQTAALYIDRQMAASYYVPAPGDESDEQQFQVTVQDGAREQGFPADSLGVWVRFSERDTFVDDEIPIRMAAYIFNTGPTPVRVASEARHLYLVVQARNLQGEWADLQDWPTRVRSHQSDPVLAPDGYWRVPVPVFDGEFVTTLRLAFTWQRTETGRPAQVLYSNPFPGRVNPGQFWRR